MAASYREYASPTGLKPLVACLWVNDRARTQPQRVVPDGCVDLMWFGERGLMVAAADTGPRPAGLRGLRPARRRLLPLGRARCPAGELMADAEPSRRLGMLTEAVLRCGAAPDSLVVAAARRFTLPSARVTDVAADLGVSERQLRRRTMFAVGYGSKTLARVARLRRLVTLGGHELAERDQQYTGRPDPGTQLTVNPSKSSVDLPLVKRGGGLRF